MTPLHFSCSQLYRPTLSFLSISSSSHQKIPPARDRVIDFGMHKGRMLGALPSKYLRWISRNLRARDYKDWASFADEVLDDPIYRDRLEWEHAERVLTGNGMANIRSDSPAADLFEIAARFGWDFDDKAGWGLVDFQLLGTSRGGRIPRIGKTHSVTVENSGISFSKRSKKKDLVVDNEKKRRERRERQRLRREEESGGTTTSEWDLLKGRGDLGGGGGGELLKGRGDLRRGGGGGEHESPFPGREVLLDKIKKRVGGRRWGETLKLSPSPNFMLEAAKKERTLQVDAVLTTSFRR